VPASEKKSSYDAVRSKPVPPIPTFPSQQLSESEEWYLGEMLCENAQTAQIMEEARKG
jgi:hypothetical protein